jgi:hypothetical protein
MISTEVSDMEKLSVKDLESGLYYYKVTSESRLQAGKIRIKSVCE